MTTSIRLLDNVELKDIPLFSRKFTWSNKREAPTLVKLDRMFCTTDWEQIFPDCLLQSLASQLSDHCPLLLGLKGYNKGKCRFHFESLWPKFEGFHDAVQQAWATPVATLCPIESLSAKLRVLSRNLQAWSQHKIGNIKVLVARQGYPPSS